MEHTDLATMTQQSLYSFVQPAVALHQPGVKINNSQGHKGPKSRHSPISAKIGGQEEGDQTKFGGVMPSNNQKGNINLEIKNDKNTE